MSEECAGHRRVNEKRVTRRECCIKRVSGREREARSERPQRVRPSDEALERGLRSVEESAKHPSTSTFDLSPAFHCNFDGQSQANHGA